MSNSPEKKKKIYVGSGKKRKENWLSITIDPDKIKDHVQEFSGHKFVKLNISIFDKADKFGKDVSVTIDDFVPQKQDGYQAMEESETTQDSGDLPF